jgi:hypothetical protein
MHKYCHHSSMLDLAITSLQDHNIHISSQQQTKQPKAPLTT